MIIDWIMMSGATFKFCVMAFFAAGFGVAAYRGDHTTRGEMVLDTSVSLMFFVGALFCMAEFLYYWGFFHG